MTKGNPMKTIRILEKFHFTTGAVALVFLLWFSSEIVFAQPPKLIEVGTTKDACSRNNAVRFKDEKGKDTYVYANENKLVRVSSEPIKDFTWFCGDSRERVANDVGFTWVRCERAANG